MLGSAGGCAGGVGIALLGRAGVDELQAHPPRPCARGRVRQERGAVLSGAGRMLALAAEVVALLLAAGPVLWLALADVEGLVVAPDLAAVRLLLRRRLDPDGRGSRTRAEVDAQPLQREVQPRRQLGNRQLVPLQLQAEHRVV